MNILQIGQDGVGHGLGKLVENICGLADPTSLMTRAAGTVRITMFGGLVEHQPAMDHSRGGIFHSFSVRFKTRNNSLIAASSVGKCPLARTARRSLEFKASMALVV